jgi:hypothetical protein
VSTFSVVIACRRSPARLAGATCPISDLAVEAPRELRLWDPEARTLRFHRELAGIVTLTSNFRWADFVTEYAALIAHAFDGIVTVADEVLAEVEIEPDPEPLSDRDLAFAWRAIDDRAQSALDDYDRAMRVKHRSSDGQRRTSRPV